MDSLAALRSAIDLMQVPSRVRTVRTLPLPGGVDWLLRVASGDRDAALEAAAATGREVEFLREAAAFFVEQVLLEPSANSYRILGTTSDASPRELRRNMALLIRCLHPDATVDPERSVFIERVTRAWEDLKTPQRRALYDSSLDESDTAPKRNAAKWRLPRVVAPRQSSPSRHGRLRRLLGKT
ncbi:MAG: DnaJ domain-containing protein [Hyphomicrobiaceae bacterium]|nr:DnaJ domain-containing protein [Hyphomicrobiaceae bacterium]